MRIGQMAAEAGCDVQTIRYYEREGLLEAPGREASGYRSYEQTHLDRLQFIRRCRSLDVSLAEIQRLLDYSRHPGQSCLDVNALVDDHIQRVRERVESLQSLERQLISLRSECNGEDAGKSCGILASFMEHPSARGQNGRRRSQGATSVRRRDI